MLQEYPTQIQPRSSSTRETQDVELQTDSNKVEAEASRILIDLANQDTTIQNLIENKLKKKERQQSDPIMLLAAAAAVIDDEGKYNGRLYERREIKLHSRHSSKRKSFTFGSIKEESDINSNMLHRRYSERRHPYQKTSSRNDLNEQKQSEGTHAFSWQYLSMKQNPRIKRNAMHAYITYMIYTDKAHQEQQQRMRYDNKSTINDWYNNQNNNIQSYRLPPSPRQRHELSPIPTNNESIIGRPLTSFLLNDNRILPPPPPPPSSNSFYYK